MARIGSAALFLAAFVWGTSFVMMKDVSEKLPPSLLLALRFTLGCILLSVLFIKRFKKLDKTYLLPGLVIGALLFSAYLVQTYGLIGTTPGKNAFLTASYCVITPFLFWFVSKKRPDCYHMTAAIVCLIGIFFISVAFSMRHISLPSPRWQTTKTHCLSPFCSLAWRLCFRGSPMPFCLLLVLHPLRRRLMMHPVLRYSLYIFPSCVRR